MLQALNPGGPGLAGKGLPDMAAVWAEAHAALQDQLERRDAGHALQRLARSVHHLLGCAVRLDAGPGPAASGVFAAGPALPEDPARCWRLALRHAGADVGVLVLAAPPGWNRPALARRIEPLLSTAGSLLAAWLADAGGRPSAAQVMTRAAMREGGCFVWEWDIVRDSLGDIDEGALMLGYAPGAIGHTQEDWNRLIHPDDAQAVEDAYQAHVRGDQPQYRAIYRALRADGQWMWVEERGRIIERGPSGEPLRMLGTQTDATAQMALQQARQDQWAAEAANAAKTRFLSRMSHELRTPLNAVLGFAQLMELDTHSRLDETQRRRVSLIRQAGDYLLAMIGDLLDLSLIESGRLQVQVAPVHLPALAVDAVDMVRGQAQAAQVTLLAPALPPQALVLADPMRLKQVLINLLTNGIKYNRPGGSVQLSARVEADGHCLIEVADDGPGIAPEQMDQLFQPFNRLGREHSGVPGSGLGLALSQNLVRAMGGELSARSTVGQGAVFSIRLPSAA